jgi:hypothetical protein
MQMELIQHIRTTEKELSLSISKSFAQFQRSKQTLDDIRNLLFHIENQFFYMTAPAYKLLEEKIVEEETKQISELEQQEQQHIKEVMEGEKNNFDPATV